MALTPVTPPATEPVSLAEAKLHLRVVHSADDTLITAQIVAARERVEKEVRRALITQSWRYARDAFPFGDIALPLPVLRSVTSVEYVDEAGDVVTLDPSLYSVDAFSEPGRIRPSDCWPSTKCSALNAVRVVFEAGYGASSDVPASIKAAILLYLGDMFENRESQAAGVTLASNPTVDALLAPYVVFGP
jgi:uncharacterized phiE125 gp8 family phage protein